MLILRIDSLSVFSDGSSDVRTFRIQPAVRKQIIYWEESWQMFTRGGKTWGLCFPSSRRMAALWLWRCSPIFLLLCRWRGHQTNSDLRRLLRKRRFSVQKQEARIIFIAIYSFNFIRCIFVQIFLPILRMVTNVFPMKLRSKCLFTK